MGDTILEDIHKVIIGRIRIINDCIEALESERAALVDVSVLVDKKLEEVTLKGVRSLRPDKEFQ